MFNVRRWSPRRLLAVWGGYWIGLAVVALGPAANAFLTLARERTGKLSVSAGFDDSMLSLSVIRDGIAAWTGSISSVMLALWVAGPPLVVWVLWLSRNMAEPRTAAAIRAPAPDALDRGDAGGRAVRIDERTPVRHHDG